DCPAATPFDRNKLKPILENLRTEWPDFLSAKDPDAFWEHEWYKHGRCAVEDELIKDELGYFNTSLNLHWKLPIMKLLAESGIHPSDSEPLEGEAAKLLEVRICFNPKLEMISCYQQGMNEGEIDINAGRKIEGSMPCPDKLILPQHPES
ncbi:hypothetical protein T265_13196, partial [Opisthorchis viverrini]